MSGSHEENPTLQRELAMSLLGDQLGSGIGRRAFVWRLDPTLVAKVEDCNGDRFQNVIEWETWKRVAGTKHARWFAPCVWVSQCGSILLMRRTTPAAQFPERMPAYLSDFKRTNYGLYDGRVVCHDYGLNLLMENGLTTRMRRAQWWGEA